VGQAVELPLRLHGKVLELTHALALVLGDGLVDDLFRFIEDSLSLGLLVQSLDLSFERTEHVHQRHLLSWLGLAERLNDALDSIDAAGKFGDEPLGVAVGLADLVV
jgi:hypothetical protein